MFLFQKGAVNLLHTVWIILFCIVLKTGTYTGFYYPVLTVSVPLGVLKYFINILSFQAKRTSLKASEPAVATPKIKNPTVIITADIIYC